jgi:hypothetical protein
MQAPKKTHAYHTPENAAASPSGGEKLVFIYIDMSARGRACKNLKLDLPVYLESAVCIHQTKSRNVIVAFQSGNARRGYQRLASYGKSEVMVMMDDTTLWGKRLSEKLNARGLKLNELRVLSRDHEWQLLMFLAIIARGSGLRVDFQNDDDGALANESTSSDITPQIERQ